MFEAVIVYVFVLAMLKHLFLPDFPAMLHFALIAIINNGRLAHS